MQAMGNLFSRRNSNSPAGQTVAISQPDTTMAGAQSPAVGVPIALEAVSIDASSTNAAAASVVLHCAAEKRALSSTDEHTMIAMLSLVAPDADSSASRAPLDLVLAIDVSGSMRGPKMELMKQTLNLLITRSGLRSTDRVSLVTFDSRVSTKLSLTEMGAEGRAQAEDIVKRLEPGSATNLSGGLLKAVDVFANDTAAAASSEGRSRSVLLFTDGLATDGIRHTPALVDAVSKAVAEVRTPINLFAFGFGSDHDDQCLRKLASGTSSGSMYYYVGTAEDIPTAFADCLGGLVSVVAQNAVLSLSAVEGGASIVRVLGSTYSRNAADGSIELGDLLAKDEKDLLVELRLPSLPSAAGAAAPVLRASLRAFNIAKAQTETAHAVLEVARPDSTPADQPTNMAIEVQKMRIMAAEAMESASALADGGNIEAGRQALLSMRGALMASPAAPSDLGRALTAEMDGLTMQYSTEYAYRSVGSKATKMSSLSHARQRATHSNEGAYSGAMSMKRAMKASWTSSAP
jgi:Mg-chelatase subunit ChlD